MIKHLDLFSGIGGFALAARMVGGIDTRQFVEIDPYCQRVLAKNFPGVPTHGDIRTFTTQSRAFDLITAGFPCQPHSQAGKRQASKDDRDLWPELYRIICQVQPRWVVLENVRGLLNSEAGRFFRGVLWDLARAGFDAEWAIVSASDLGASHRRDRVWVVAYSNGIRHSQQPPQLHPSSDQERHHQASKQAGRAKLHAPLPGGEIVADPNRNRLAAWQSISQKSGGLTQLKRLDGRNGRGFASEPVLRRGDDGLPHRVDRVRALGNAVSPQVAAIPLMRVKELAAA